MYICKVINNEKLKVMKTIEEKREELKNERVMLWFDNIDSITLEQTMHFITIKDLSDNELSRIWSDIFLWNVNSHFVLIDGERKSKLNWEKR